MPAMMPDDLEKHLTTRAAAMGFALSEVAAGALLRWRDRLLEENARINLTAIKDPEAATDRLILDSLAVLRHVDAQGTAIHRVLDLGTGGGVPGVPIAIARPELQVTLVEARLRKTEAVRRIAEDLALTNVDVVRGRLSELAHQGALTEKQDLVVSRAVGSIEDVLRESAPILNPRGVVVIWKTDPLDADEERAGDRRAGKLRCHRLEDLVHDAYKPTRLVRYQKSGEPA